MKEAAFEKVNGLRNLKVNEAPEGVLYEPEKGFNVDGKWGHGLTHPLPEVNGVYEADVYLGEGAFKSAKKLFYTMGHEFCHVQHYYYLGGKGIKGWKYTKYTEYAAWKWIHTNAKGAGDIFIQRGASEVLDDIGTYYKSNFINLNIKVKSTWTW